MGLSSSKSTTSTKPVYDSQLTGAANNITAAYGTQAPKISGITDQLAALAPDIVRRFQQGDPNVRAASDYNAKVLNGDYLNGNPYIDQIVQQTNDGTRNGLAASLGTRGLTGGSAFTDIISRGLAQNESGIRYQNYNSERDRMGQAAALAPTISGAQYQPLDALSSILQAQMAPVQAATGAGAGVGGLLGSYTNSTQKQSPSLMSSIGQAAQIAALFSDRRLKTDIRKIGEYADGLGKYVFRYIWDDQPREGVMADEVAKLRPWALGPTINGFATVQMEAL